VFTFINFSGIVIQINSIKLNELSGVK
jgi:hypothetical protein